MSTELCGVITRSGKPCNMPKNHSARFHRNREYKNPLEWIIKDAKTGKVLESGNGRIHFSSAFTYWLKKGNALMIEVEP